MQVSKYILATLLTTIDLIDPKFHGNVWKQSISFQVNTKTNQKLGLGEIRNRAVSDFRIC